MARDKVETGSRTIRDVMTPNPASVSEKDSIKSTVKEDTPINEVLQLMSREQIRRVPVTNSNNELIGIVSIGDIASDEKETVKVGRTVEDISEAPPNN